MATGLATIGLRHRQRVTRYGGRLARCRDYMDAAISIVKPGITTADIVKLWPKAEEFGFANEEAAFALQYATAWACRFGRSRSSAA
jgi:hypothetical protein